MSFSALLTRAYTLQLGFACFVSYHGAGDWPDACCVLARCASACVNVCVCVCVPVFLVCLCSSRHRHSLGNMVSTVSSKWGGSLALRSRLLFKQTGTNSTAALPVALTTTDEGRFTPNATLAFLCVGCGRRMHLSAIMTLTAGGCCSCGGPHGDARVWACLGVITLLSISGVQLVLPVGTTGMLAVEMLGSMWADASSARCVVCKRAPFHCCALCWVPKPHTECGPQCLRCVLFLRLRPRCVVVVVRSLSVASHDKSQQHVFLQIRRTTKPNRVEAF